MNKYAVFNEKPNKLNLRPNSLQRVKSSSAITKISLNQLKYLIEIFKYLYELLPSATDNVNFSRVADMAKGRHRVKEEVRVRQLKLDNTKQNAGFALATLLVSTGAISLTIAIIATIRRLLG